MRWLKRLWQWPLERIPRHVYPLAGTPEQREALDRVTETPRPADLGQWCAERYPRR